MNHDIIKMVLTVSVLTMLSIGRSLLGADLVIPSGDVQTISGNQTYGQVIVNGTLNILDGSKISVSRLMCGTNSASAAVLNIGKGVALSVSGKESNGLDCCFSYDTPCEVNLAEGSSIASAYISLSYLGTGTSMLSVSNATVQASATFYFGRNSTSSTIDRTLWTAQVRLTGAEARLKVNNLTRNQYASARVLFDGGRLMSCSNREAGFINSNQNNRNTKLMLEGVDGYPITIEINHSLKYLFAASNGTNTRVGTQGDCDFVLCGNKGIVLGSSSYVDAQTLTHTGKTIVLNPSLSLNRANILPATTVVEVGDSSTLDLAGHSQSIAGVLSNGNLIDSLNAAVLTLSGTKGDSLLCEGTDNLAGLRINGGCVRIRCRRRTGYRFYKFEPKSRYGSSATGTQYNEIYLFDNDGKDVTAKRSSYAFGALMEESPQPEKALDGNPATKYYIAGAVEKSWLSLEFSERQPVSYYTFATGDDYGPIHKYAGRTDVTEPSSYNKEQCRDVCAFDFKGSDDGENWRIIHSVDPFVPEDTRNYTYPKWEWPRKVSIDDIHIEKNAVLELDDVEATVGAMFCRGELVRLNGSEVVLGGENDSSVLYPGFSGGLNLTKTGSGVTTVLGDNSFSGAIAVEEGTLRFADIGAVGPFFRFVVTANRDGVNENTVQYSEFALYNVKGERVNSNLVFNDINKGLDQLSPGEITAITKAASSSERPEKMTDGDTNTKCGLYVATKPNPVTMRLAEAYAAERVVSYAIASANDHIERDPSGWYLEASTDGVEWVRLDTKELETVGSVRNSYAAYNEGVPYYATNLIACTTAFSPETTVSVSKDAVLDLFGSSTEMGSLKIDCGSAGEIRGGVIAEDGVVDIVGLPSDQHVFALPLMLTGVRECSRFASWRVLCDGVSKPYSVYCRGGRILVCKPGMKVVFR